MYFLAFFFPPLAVAMCGKPWQALLCLFLSLLFWFPGMFYAFAVVSEYKAHQRHKELLTALKSTRTLQWP
jgi:uncharacterized membrane protein YqaE (UPF0057 family)